MNKTKRLLSVIVALTLVFVIAVFSACKNKNEENGDPSNNKPSVLPDDEAEVVSIAVAAFPDKTSYWPYESFDPTGMTVNLTYDDGTVREISQRYCDFEPEGGLTPETTSITVSFEELTASFDIEVYDAVLKGVEVSLGSGFIPVANIDDVLDLSDATVTASYEYEGKTEEIDVTDSCEIKINDRPIINMSGVSFRDSGKNALSFDFGPEHYEAYIDVFDGSYLGMVADFRGSDNIKLKGESYDLSGLEVVRMYDTDGGVKVTEVGDYTVMINGEEYSSEELTSVIFDKKGVTDVLVTSGTEKATQRFFTVDGEKLSVQTSESDGETTFSITSDVSRIVDVLMTFESESETNLASEYISAEFTPASGTAQTIALGNDVIYASSDAGYTDVRLGEFTLGIGINTFVLTPSSDGVAQAVSAEVRDKTDLLIGGIKDIYKTLSTDLSSLSVVICPFAYDAEVADISDCTVKLNGSEVVDLESPGLFTVGANSLEISYGNYTSSEELIYYKDVYVESDEMYDPSVGYAIIEAEDMTLGGTDLSGDNVTMKVKSHSGASGGEGVDNIRYGHALSGSFVSEGEGYAEIYVSLASSRAETYSISAKETFTVKCNGTQALLTQNVYGTGSWETFKDYYLGTVYVPAGEVSFEVNMGKLAYNCNLDYFRLVPLETGEDAELVIEGIDTSYDEPVVDWSGITASVRWGIKAYAVNISECTVKVGGEEVTDLGAVTLAAGNNEVTVEYGSYTYAQNVTYNVSSAVDIESAGYFIEAEDMTLSDNVVENLKLTVKNSSAASGSKDVQNVRKDHWIEMSFESAKECEAILYICVSSGRKDTYTYMPSEVFTTTLNGVEVALSQEECIAGTGGWTTYQEYAVGTVSIPAGTVTIRLTMVGQAYNFNFDYLRFEAGGTL